MSDFRIVEYNPTYAKSVADMWNRSRDSWGGNNAIKTEEAVLREHENSANLNVFLAVEEKSGDVIGYCSFSRYSNDEGALYIPLLNVRPDYHGKKVGRALVTRGVERTVELGWPRLDLFTWPGNTKAVPVYKKCGFFWEKRDDSTHLMNFIPTVLQTEALQEHFQEIHWYDDSKRVIEVIPDGRKENDFILYEYLWEKNGKYLRVEFEKAGRGMRLIDTEDYCICASVSNHELVFGRSYKVTYDFVNKTGKPLEISIKGLDNKNIRFTMEETVVVTDQSVLEGNFHVGEITEEQNTWRTHPAVISELRINGKKAVFKLGIVPKFPARFALHIPGVETYRNSESECYAEITNNFKENTVFEFEIPAAEKISITTSKHSVSLTPGERKLVPLQYSITDACAYRVEIPVTAVLNSGERVAFKARLSGLFKGRTGMFGGEDEGSWYIYNSGFATHQWKGNNGIMTFGHVREDHNTIFDSPKLGRPYSKEFTITRPVRVEQYEENSGMVMKAIFESNDFPGIELFSITRLYPGGIVERNYEIHNRTEQEMPDEIWLNDSLYHDLYRAVLPYAGEYMEINDSHDDSLDFWDSNKLTENWIFSRGNKLTRGLCWDKSYKISFGGHRMTFEHSFGKLSGGQSIATLPITVVMGTFDRWQDFRGYALKQASPQGLRTTDSLSMSVNEGNPFVFGEYPVKVRDVKNSRFDGQLTLHSGKGSFDCLVQCFSAEENKKEAEFTALAARESIGEELMLEINQDTQVFERKAFVFFTGKEAIRLNKASSNGYEVFSAANASIEIKAAPAFSYSLTSMTHEGQEWLESSFPKAGPKSWWNPWIGGIGTKPWDLANISAMQEARTGDFTEKTDSCGNVWRGIKLGVKVERNEKFKGLEYDQYFLLLPGVPVMCHVVEIQQNTGSYMNFTGFGTESFLKPDPEIKNSWVLAKNRAGAIVKYKSGRASFEIHSDGSLLFGSNTRQTKLQIVGDPEVSQRMALLNVRDSAAFLTNTVSAAHGGRVLTAPSFFIFTKEAIDDKLLMDLHKIRFI
jgi:RimJ/RimL family protein N-acetyltransferase